MRRPEGWEGRKQLMADQRATWVTVAAGRPDEAAMSRSVEAGVYDGNDFDRTAKVGGCATVAFECCSNIMIRYMALPQHKKIPQPPEGSTYTS
jgi:hypothetical protein